MPAHIIPRGTIIWSDTTVIGASGASVSMTVPRKGRIWRVRGLRSAGTGVTFDVLEVQKAAPTPAAALGTSHIDMLQANNGVAGNPLEWAPTLPIMYEATLADNRDGVGTISIWIDPDAAWTGRIGLEIEELV